MTGMNPTLDEGALAFTVEGRLLRELGERLVRQPDIALIELVKNSYDADATECTVRLSKNALTVSDDGTGMTFASFRDGWMNIGTAIKASGEGSKKYHRPITGEKGIGRFAVRFLGRRLQLRTVADDHSRGFRTRLEAEFDWPRLDELDFASIKVPYRLQRADDEDPTGTTLIIGELREAVDELDAKNVRSSSLSVVSPLRSLLDTSRPNVKADPGFSLELTGLEDDDEYPEDLALSVLDQYTLRAVLQCTRNGKLKLRVYTRDSNKAVVSINENGPQHLGAVRADIRFFPRRKGAFRHLGVDGRTAYRWIRENGGVAVFDRGFRVSPYGEPTDDWLGLQADISRNYRDPRSAIALKYFQMTPEERSSTADNWMLRLPSSAQLVGVVEVAGARSSSSHSNNGLIAAADREGFVENNAFRDLVDLVRGGVESLAYQDRQEQRAADETAQAEAAARSEREAQAAIAEIRQYENLPPGIKKRLIDRISATADAARTSEDIARERIRQLRVMSLMGVVAGFMTHEFGAAVAELEEAAQILESTPDGSVNSRGLASKLRGHKSNLEEYVRYTTAYVRGSRAEAPEAQYPVLPRLRQVVKTFGKYAKDRGIDIELNVSKDLLAPRVPVALYNGVALNLFSNALKAVTATTEGSPGRVTFRAWNERGWHSLEISDTGVGIPPLLRERIFDPLFTTTSEGSDPLGSGMGLGLSLVRQVVSTFSGTVSVVDPPPGFATTIRVRLPLETK